MKIRLLKLIDRLLGVFATACLPSVPVRPFPALRRFLVIRPGGIGDAVLLISSISTLKLKFPDASITVLAERRNASVFRLSPHVDKVLCYDNPKELLKAIRAKYDVVIDTEQWHRLSAVVARLTKSVLSIGFATNERKKMFTNAVHYSHEDYEMDSFYHLLQPLGITESEIGKPPFLVVPDGAVIKVNAMLGKLADKPFITIFPGSSIHEKRWDMVNFVKLALNFNQVGLPIIVIGSEKDRVAAEAMTGGLDAMNFAGKTSLVETAALIDKSALFVSGDSGVLHIAVGLGKPTVSLFGPSNTRKWAPRGDRHIVISKNLPCAPCAKFGYTPKCPINAGCMGAISPAEVVAAVYKLLRVIAADG
jgi:lipopolysaccharide heptosyltransferase II